MLTLKDALASSSDEDDVLALAQAELKSQGLYEQPVRQYNEAPKVVSKRKRHLEEKRTMKLNKLTNLNKCKHEGFCCKKNCRQFYTPSQVQLLRRSVHSRGAYDKRTFVKARIKVDVDAYNANQETRIGARDPIRTFTLDVCNHAIVDDMTILPLLCPEVSRRVCCRFFRFALGVSLNFIYQPGQERQCMLKERKGIYAKLHDLIRGKVYLLGCCSWRNGTSTNRTPTLCYFHSVVVQQYSNCTMTTAKPLRI
jgi:hypothetical protein